MPWGFWIIMPIVTIVCAEKINKLLIIRKKMLTIVIEKKIKIRRYATIVIDN